MLTMVQVAFFLRSCSDGFKLSQFFLKKNSFLVVFVVWDGVGS